jgi:hypothetical protein
MSKIIFKNKKIIILIYFKVKNTLKTIVTTLPTRLNISVFIPSTTLTWIENTATVAQIFIGCVGYNINDIRVHFDGKLKLRFW